MTMLSVVMQPVAAMHALQQRPVGHAGRGEDAVALGHVLQAIDAVEVLDPPAARAGDLVVVAEHEPALHLPADAAQRGRREHALGRAAGADVDVDAGVRVGRRDHAGDIAVGDQPDAAAERAKLGDDSVVPVRSSTQAMISAGSTPLALAIERTLSATELREVDRAFGIARADRQLLHVDVGRVEQAAALGDRQHRERVRPGLGGDRRALRAGRARCRSSGRYPAPSRRCSPM